MSEPIDDYAFPQYARSADKECATGGMSLRAWFAGQALAILRVGDWSEIHHGAKYCVDYADALIAELAKPLPVKPQSKVTLETETT